MSLNSRHSAALLSSAAVAATVVLAPVSAAEPIEPGSGSESPGKTVSDLTNQGYDVTIEWVRGKPDVVPLSQCVVTNVNIAAKPHAYVSISCPPASSQ